MTHFFFQLVDGDWQFIYGWHPYPNLPITADDISRWEDAEYLAW